MDHSISDYFSLKMLGFLVPWIAFFFTKKYSNSFRRETVPANTICAITPTFYEYNPPTRGNYSSFYIHKPNYMVNLLIPEQDLNRQLKSQEKQFQEQINELKQEKATKQSENNVLLAQQRKFQVKSSNSHCSNI